MKKVEIITRPFLLDEIKDFLSSEGIEKIIASDVRVSGGHSNSDNYLQEDYFVEFMQKITIVFYSEAKNLKNILDKIKNLSEQDAPEDTDIFVYTVDEKI